jgi:TatD DNase family protein
MENCGIMIDTHCHLFMEPLASDAPGVLRRAAASGVDRVVVPSFDMGSWSEVRELSRQPGVYPALGLHPWNAGSGLDIHRLRTGLSGLEPVAIGEIGLDFKIPDASRQIQVRVFRSQLDLALEMDLPVILHCRGAFDEMAAILEEDAYRGRLRGVLHAYTRSPQTAGRFLALGFYLAFGGGVTRSRAGRARRSASVVPLDRILLETDAPSIGMEGLEPDQVEPAHIVRVAETIAALRGMDPAEIASLTTANAELLFGL